MELNEFNHHNEINEAPTPEAKHEVSPEIEERNKKGLEDSENRTDSSNPESRSAKKDPSDINDTGKDKENASELPEPEKEPVIREAPKTEVAGPDMDSARTTPLAEIDDGKYHAKPLTEDQKRRIEDLDNGSVENKNYTEPYKATARPPEINEQDKAQGIEKKHDPDDVYRAKQRLPEADEPLEDNPSAKVEESPQQAPAIEPYKATAYPSESSELEEPQIEKSKYTPEDVYKSKEQLPEANEPLKDSSYDAESPEKRGYELPEGCKTVNANDIDMSDAMGMDDPNFWNHHNRTKEDYMDLASKLPDVQNRLNNGESIESLYNDPNLGDTAYQYYSPEKMVRVNEQPDGSYEFIDDGRHRVSAAQELGYDIPVKIENHQDYPVTDQDNVVTTRSGDISDKYSFDSGASAYDQLATYYSSHNYGQQDYPEYSQNPEWQELNNSYLQEIGKAPIDYASDGVAVENLDEDTISNSDTTGETKEVQPIENLDGWLKDINPNFDPFDVDSPYSNNCGSCAYAVYQRLEGNPDICATAEIIGYNSEMEALTGMEQVSMSPQEIEERLLEQGTGSHAIIGIDRAEGPGHWFNAANIDGKIVAIDGQDGSITDWPPDYGNVVNWEMSIKKE